MGSGSKNKKTGMGNAPADSESLEAQRWCIRNNIYISPKAINENSWRIEIINRGNKNVDPSVYRRTEVWEKLFEYCKFYYNKYGKRV
jgi:hypothetical protein